MNQERKKARQMIFKTFESLFKDKVDLELVNLRLKASKEILKQTATDIEIDLLRAERVDKQDDLSNYITLHKDY